MKENIKKMLDAKNKQLEELRKKNDAAQTVEELRNIQEQINTVTEERNGLQVMYDNFDKPADGGKRGGFAFGSTIENGTNKTDAQAAAEERAKKFAESNRMTISNQEARASLLVSGNTIAQPVGVAGINGLFPQVSSIVDMVKIVDASGMGGGYKTAYQIDDADAAAHTEGAAATQSEPTFGIITITAQDKALVSYISNKVRKQSPLTYEQKVRESAMTALRKAASKMIVDALSASTLTEAMDIAVVGGKGVIDEKFLRNITLRLGGDESIGGGAVLMLNKLDLIALGDVRGDGKKAVYEITPDAGNPNTGIIKDGGLSVRYVINSNCPALSSTAQVTTGAIKGIYYGNPQAIELAMFGDYEVKTSEDYKFAEDMLAVRGTASMGAGMGMYKGFVVAQIAKGA